MTRSVDRKYQAGFLLTSVAMLGLLGAGLTAGPPRAPGELTPKKCKQLVDSDKQTGPFPESGGAILVFGRSKSWSDGDELETGKWVGMIENVATSPSNLFPDLKQKNDVGCLTFTRKQKGESAMFKPDNGRGTDMKAAICTHSNPHDPSIMPKLTTFETDCTDVHATVATPYGQVSIRVQGTGGHSPSNAQIEDAFYQALRPVALKMTEAQARAEAKEQTRLLTMVVGTWWPCSQNGCCKAY